MEIDNRHAVVIYIYIYIHFSVSIYFVFLQLPESAGPVRSIARGIVNENEEFQVAVGTTKNSLLAGTFDDGLTSLVTVRGLCS